MENKQLSDDPVLNLGAGKPAEGIRPAAPWPQDPGDEGIRPAAPWPQDPGDEGIRPAGSGDGHKAPGDGGDGAQAAAARAALPAAGPVPVPANLERYRKLHEEALFTEPSKIEIQHSKGKLTARERLDALLDPGSFEELGLMAKTRATAFGLQKKAGMGDGVITGFGKIGGRKVAVFAQDFMMLGGTIGLVHAQKVIRLMDVALQARVPLIGVLDSGGARIQEGVDSLDGYAGIFARNVRGSGSIPQISMILGPCAGGAVYSPALTDFVFMAKGISQMFITGPSVVKAAIGEIVDFETLGGGQVHATKSGLCHFLCPSEAECFARVKELLSYLPKSRWDSPPSAPATDPADRAVPELEKVLSLSPRKAYDMLQIIAAIADDRKVLEIHKDFARNVVVGFLRLGGETVGVVANNPKYGAGALDIDASEKAARFVRFLSNFNIPLLTLADVPGYVPGVQQEHGGIIRRGAKLLFAYAECASPKVTVVLRKAYGGAYIAMGSKWLGGDINFAFPSAEIAVMGPAGAVEILYRREIQEAANPEELKARLAKEYADEFASPYQTAGTGSVDEVIEPSATRAKLIRAFETLKDKRRPGEGACRGNIPL